MTGGEVTFDMREVNRLAVTLAAASTRVVPALAPVIEQAAVTVRDDLRDAARAASRDGTTRHFPRSITHDVRGLSAEIGPDKNRRQGALGNLLYFGGARSGPVLPPPGESLRRHAGAIADAAAVAAAAVVLP